MVFAWELLPQEIAPYVKLSHVDVFRNESSTRRALAHRGGTYFYPIPPPLNEAQYIPPPPARFLSTGWTSSPLSDADTQNNADEQELQRKRRARRFFATLGWVAGGSDVLIVWHRSLLIALEVRSRCCMQFATTKMQLSCNHVMHTVPNTCAKCSTALAVGEQNSAPGDLHKLRINRWCCYQILMSRLTCIKRVWGYAVSSAVCIVLICIWMHIVHKHYVQRAMRSVELNTRHEVQGHTPDFYIPPRRRDSAVYSQPMHNGERNH